jgi:hypothetical protein
MFWLAFYVPAPTSDAQHHGFEGHDIAYREPLRALQRAVHPARPDSRSYLV